MHETRVFDSELQTYETQVQFFAPKMATLGKSTKGPYLIFVIFFTRSKVFENKIYTEKRQFFALNL